MSFRSCYAALLTVLIGSLSFMYANPGGAEYIGQFDKSLVANVEEFERVILKRDAADKWAGLGSFASSANFSSGRFSNPQTGQFSVFALLVENGNDTPVIFADVNDDSKLTSDEKFPLVQEKKDNPFLWTTTIPIGLKEGFFSSCPIFVRYFKSIQTEKMATGDRLVTQSTEVMARGSVDVKGRKVIVQYALPAGEKKVNPQQGWVGVDIDGDGAVDMDNLSPEAARADAEAVVFKVGDTYLSTKKADVSKNQIIMREHEAKEYKRFELGMGKLFPEFNFTDFEGKKRKISDFRGKYVLLDIWGFWCGPCRKELPYIREAHKRFQGRNLEIVGLNTDEDFTIESMKKGLKDSGMTWTNAKFDSVVDFLRVNLRITSFPTTFLISPEGKILSMSRQERDEPDLRGKDLLESLDEVLPN
jgi:thiol-disulfide isomerase/thioredoxin